MTTEAIATVTSAIKAAASNAALVAHGAIVTASTVASQNVVAAISGNPVAAPKLSLESTVIGELEAFRKEVGLFFHSIVAAPEHAVDVVVHAVRVAVAAVASVFKRI